MRVFCHASDHLEATWRHLPTLLLLSKPLVLWAPSATSIVQAFERGESVIGLNGIIELLEAGHVEIHAREGWFDPQRRKSEGFRDGGTWTNFDETLFQKFRRHGSGFDGLYAHPNGSGDAWADKQIESNSDAYKTALELAAAGKTIRGTEEKAQRFGSGTQHDIARVALRDAKNHVEALNFVNAGPDVEPDEHWWTRPLLCEADSHFQMPKGEPFNFERLERVAAVVSEVSPPRDADDIIVLKERFGEELRFQLWQLFGDENDPMASAQADLEELARRKNLMEIVCGKSWVEGGISFTGFLTALLDVRLDASTLLTAVSLACGAIPPLKNWAEDEGFTPMSAPEESSASFKLAYKRLPWFPYLRAPTATEVRETLLRMTRLRRS